jgi:hypothetical protein
LLQKLRLTLAVLQFQLQPQLVQPSLRLLVLAVLQLHQQQVWQQLVPLPLHLLVLAEQQVARSLANVPRGQPAAAAVAIQQAPDQATP